MQSGLAIIPVARASDLEAQAQREMQAQNAKPIIQGLASHVRSRWETAKDAKRDLEERMIECLRQRNGEYDPSILAEIQSQGGSDIYIQLTSVKCRAATSWLRDTLLGVGADRPWSLESTPVPDLPPEVVQGLQAKMATQLMQTYAAGGQPLPEEQLQAAAAQMKDAALRELKEEAEKRVERMEDKMEDQLIEGGFTKAFNEFLDDVVTFPFAVVKGPVKRKRKKLMYAQGGGLEPVEEIRNEWERVDPFNLYWAPWASDIQDGFVIERHKLTRPALESLIGVEGYSEAAIRTVLGDFETGGLKEWLWTDMSQAEAEGKDTTETLHTTDLVDAIQLWDSVQGKELLDWGMSEEEIPDPHLSYPCEVWLIGGTVIKAVLNYDPLGRKPYYVTSYELLPGSIAGKGVTDLCRDSQKMVNAAGRALANNMGISSGPQVGVNISRLPPGEDLTQMHPWKIWQFQQAEFADSTPPLSFFQPQSNSAELMQVFEKFSARADEDTMIPRYMTGEHVPGAGRTSSGLSMLISNAGKGIKQVISNIDQNIIVPIIERLYQDNLRYNQDPDLVGDLHVVARGANSLVVKEAEQVRRSEFLQLVLNSPVAQQIVGMDGAAELLRETAKNLSGNVDRIVPDREQISVIQQQQQIIQQLQNQLQAFMGAAQEAMQGQGTPPAPDSRNILPDGSQMGGREGNIMANRVTGR
jgi:8-oxo-dGTP pyrophosphatase MutT (NUDIX family)